MVAAALQLLGEEMEDATEDGVDKFSVMEKEGCVEGAATGIGPTMLEEEGRVLEVFHG